MWLYRFEDESGEGPYMSLGHCCNLGMALHEDHTGSYVHPNRYKDHLNKVGKHYCTGVAELKRWFGGFIPRLIRAGFKVLKEYYPLSDIEIGTSKTQACVDDQPPFITIDITSEFAGMNTTVDIAN